MRPIAIALLIASASFACAQSNSSQTNDQNPCSANVSSSLPESSGCMPLTYKPADGGPERPVIVPIQFIYPVGGPVKVPPTASRMLEFQIGAFGAYTRPDYGTRGNVDVGMYASLMAKHVGIEVDAMDTVEARGGIREASIVAGPRVQLRYKPLTFYAKAQAGAARFNVSPADKLNNGTVRAVEQYGGGVELSVKRNLRFRLVDYSYQVWPEFNPSNLTPTVISSGIAYHF